MCTPTCQTTTRPPSSAAWTEARLLINLVAPTVLIQLGATFPPALTASYIGRHLGAIYLDGFTLACLTGNLFTLSLLSGLFSASDTLSPQAFGAGNYKEVGLLAIRAYIASLIVIIPINILLAIYMKDLLISFGENDETALLAAQWYRVYMYGLPFYAFYNVTWKFLSAQAVMFPLVVVLMATCGIVLPLTLHQLVPRFGFMGSAYSILIHQASQAGMLLLYLVYYKPFIPMTWPGLQFWREALQKDKVQQFMRLGLGGMVASSEWLYWETLSLLVGTLGVLPLSVHTIPTQVLTVSFMFPIGIGIALSIRVGATLPRNVKRAQQLVVACSLVSICLFAIMSACLWVFRDRIFQIFTSEQAVLQGCEEIWWKVVLYFFCLAIYGIIIGIATGLGMQWTLGVVTCCFLFVFGLPAVYFFALVRGGGLSAAWTWVYPPYIIMNVVMVAAFLRSDWHAISANICKREGLDDTIIDQGDVEALVMHRNETLKYGSTAEQCL